MVLEVAIPLHDAILNPRRKDNEVRSSSLARNYIRRLGGTTDFSNAVRKPIIATRHNKPQTDPDCQLMCDIDLAGFGQPWEKVVLNSIGIRWEYFWYSEHDYRQGRTRILSQFDARDPIYYTPYFREKYEKKAHENIKREIAWLNS
jgi:predicted metal-dependent HD superfamily phosphohydrolase